MEERRVDGCFAMDVLKGESATNDAVFIREKSADKVECGEEGRSALETQLNGAVIVLSWYSHQAVGGFHRNVLVHNEWNLLAMRMK